MEKAESHYLLQCNYCGGFAQGRFAFIMFIEMFMLISRLKCAGCSISQCVCVLTGFRVGGWLKSADKLKRKMLSNEHSLGTCRL